MNWFCYVLQNTDEKYKNLTYIGSSNSPFERLKCHNRELSGGAKYTRKGKWRIYMLFSGFKKYADVLSFEWRLKHPNGIKRNESKYCGINGKIESLCHIISLDTWGKKENLLKSNDIILYTTINIIEKNISNLIKIVRVDQINKDILE